MTYLLCKRALDLTLSALGLVLLGPILVCLYVRARLEFGADAWFVQERPGHLGHPIRIVKFRSMTDQTDPLGRLLPDSERLTPFGSWLRSTSLDELPELWNVLRGDMSLVGPRPLLTQYLDRYSPEQARRHEVRPGITGWAQINGRNAISWEEKLALDVWYVDHRNLWLDLRILGATIWKVVRREGISAAGDATMPEFMGTQRRDQGTNRPSNPHEEAHS